jgi:signal transduction histidine kinase
MPSISRQLTFSLLAVFVGLFGTFGIYFYISSQKALRNQFDEGLRLKALLLMRVTEQRNHDLRVHLPLIKLPAFLQEFSAAEGRSAFQFWNARKETVLRSESLGQTQLERREDVARDPFAWDLTLANGRPGRALRMKYIPRLDAEHDPDIAPDEVTLVVASNRELLDDALFWQQITFAIGLTVVLGVVGWLVPAILRHGLQPLRRLRVQAEQIDAHSLKERIPTQGMPLELAPICDCLNGLLSRLEHSFERERRYSSDVAHELLTPLAELRSLCEFALRYPDSDQRESIEQSLAILLRTEKVVIMLMDLCRAEQKNARAEACTETVAVAAFLAGRLHGLEAGAAARGLSFRSTIPETAQVRADPTLLGSILTNLLSNAIDYAAPGSEIQITWTATESRFQLAVSNEAADFSRDDLPHFFDRFWRKDKARSGSGHSGLGLPLSRELAQLMGFTLTAESPAEKRVTLVLAGALPAS